MVWNWKINKRSLKQNKLKNKCLLNYHERYLQLKDSINNRKTQKKLKMITKNKYALTQKLKEKVSYQH